MGSSERSRSRRVNMAGHAHVQLLGGTARPRRSSRWRRAAQRVLEARRTERAETARGMRGREAPGQVRRGNHVAHAERGQRRLGAGAPGCASVASNSACGPYSSARRWKARLEMEGQHRIVLRQRISASASVIAAVASAARPARPPAARQAWYGSACLRLKACQGVQPVQRLLQRLGRGWPRRPAWPATARRCTCDARGRPGYAPRPPAPRPSTGWPASTRAAWPWRRSNRL